MTSCGSGDPAVSPPEPARRLPQFGTSGEGVPPLAYVTLAPNTCGRCDRCGNYHESTVCPGTLLVLPPMTGAWQIISTGVDP